MKGLRFSLWLAGFKKEIAIAHSPDAVAPVVIHKRFSACPTVNEQLRRKCLHMRLTSFPAVPVRKAVSSRLDPKGRQECAGQGRLKCSEAKRKEPKGSLEPSTFCLLHTGKAGDGSHRCTPRACKAGIIASRLSGTPYREGARARDRRQRK